MVSIDSTFLVLCRRMGIPTPVTEYRFHPTRKWRFDYCWPEHRVALEVEGGIWTGGRHTRGVGFVRDMEKYNTAALMGWKVLRCQPTELRKLVVVDMIKQAIEDTAPFKDYLRNE
jgi:very-short-patch-repair endonuclease